MFQPIKTLAAAALAVALLGAGMAPATAERLTKHGSPHPPAATILYRLTSCDAELDEDGSFEAEDLPCIHVARPGAGDNVKLTVRRGIVGIPFIVSHEKALCLRRWHARGACRAL